MAKVNSDNERFIINVGFGNDNEPRDIFVGGGERDFLITRGKDVIVPRYVMERLDLAVCGVPEVDPDDNTKTIITQRKRFPYTIVGVAP